MGQDVEGMGCGERVICLALTACFAIAVFSTVSQVLHSTRICNATILRGDLIKMQMSRLFTC